MRLFVAVWPSAEAADLLDGLHRPEHPAVRWTTRHQWHVTLRFLGDVDEAEVPAVTSALAAAGRLPPRRAIVGPATRRLGRAVLMVPVAGVDDLGAAVLEATRGFGAAPEDRSFSGHLTLARARDRSSIPARLAGQEVAASWPVTELALVRSRLASGGARYETLATTPLQPPASAHF